MLCFYYLRSLGYDYIHPRKPFFFSTPSQPCLATLGDCALRLKKLCRRFAYSKYKKIAFPIAVIRPPLVSHVDSISFLFVLETVGGTRLLKSAPMLITLIRLYLDVLRQKYLHG